jgi:hypothetical protein
MQNMEFRWRLFALMSEQVLESASHLTTNSLFRIPPSTLRHQQRGAD